MAQFYDTDDFLAKWADGTLTAEEKEAFKKTDEYKHYQAILEGTDLLQVPPFNNDTVYKGVKEKIASSKKTFSIAPKIWYAAAAAVLLIVSLSIFFNRDTGFQTGFGEQLVVNLPDNSEVILNSNSILNFDENDWKKGNRVVLLEGEGFFKVEKGSTFTVNVDDGSVQVLGTQFTVNTASKVFEVICYEGKVAVSKGGVSKVISKGEAVRVVDNALENWNTTVEAPSWLNNESSFNNAPVEQVIVAIENQYGIMVNTDQVVVDDLRFTGSFTHDDLNTALQTVFDALEINFIFSDNITVDLVVKN